MGDFSPDSDDEAPPKKRGGRKKSRLPEVVLDRLGPPPTGALALANWHSKLLAEVTWLLARGEIDRTHAMELTRACSQGGKMIAPDVLNDVDRLLRTEHDQIAADDPGPEEERAEQRTRPALRRDPR